MQAYELEEKIDDRMLYGYDVWLHESGEYGSFVELPVTRLEVDEQNKRIILYD